MCGCETVSDLMMMMIDDEEEREREGERERERKSWKLGGFNKN